MFMSIYLLEPTVLYTVWRETFERENFHESMKYKISWIHHPPDIMQSGPHPFFVEKTFTNSIRAAKFVKVFSLKSFPLYGNNVTMYTYS